MATEDENETILKGGVSLFDSLKFIRTSSASERKAVIAVFKKHKINKWPDGRKLEEVIL